MADEAIQMKDARVSLPKDGLEFRRALVNDLLPAVAGANGTGYLGDLDSDTFPIKVGNRLYDDAAIYGYALGDQDDDLLRVVVVFDREKYIIRGEGFERTRVAVINLVTDDGALQPVQAITADKHVTDGPFYHEDIVSFLRFL